MSLERTERIRAMFDTSGFGLEIGPSHAPLLAKRDGFNVETLDHADAAELRRKYGGQPGADRIEEVDYVWRGGAIHDAVPRRGEYDFVFSSHVIEHVPDFLGYLESCALLLKPSGVIALAVPDKRFNFDALRPHSTTGDVMQANREGVSKHRLAAIFDGSADFVQLGNRDDWNSLNRGPLHFRNGLADAAHMLDLAAAPDSPYIDVHGWCFSPISFQLIMRDLRELGVTPFGIRTVIEGGGLEFYVILSTDAPDHALSRAQLKRWFLLEQILSHVQLLGGSEDLKLQLFHALEVNQEVAVV